ncbi:borealin [Syngnathus scovelli]|uniref:borealin n=1 Tax=Syngnathus scovelli TaxID=161590 RepID=UPI00210F585B|nr:borealin [Syngnathus scovelli]
MAPRKRTTKQVKKQLSSSKLNAFLEDFDIEVQTRLHQLQEREFHLLKDLRNSYNMAIIKLPSDYRKMTWLEIFTSEQKSAAKSGSNEEKAPKTLKKGRPAKKPPTTSKRAKALSIIQQNGPVRRSSRNPTVTPARSLLDASMMGKTPLITPRFDPRLPNTPGLRVPRHKERVFSFSVNGSPIADNNDEIIINVPVGNGESIQLLASQVDSVDLSTLGETALRNIRLLQSRLSTLCES